MWPAVPPRRFGAAVNFTGIEDATNRLVEAARSDSAQSTWG
jgi:hypothetical protein